MLAPLPSLKEGVGGWLVGWWCCGVVALLCYWSLVVGRWLLVVGLCSLVRLVGCWFVWLLVAGSLVLWFLAVADKIMPAATNWLTIWNSRQITSITWTKKKKKKKKQEQEKQNNYDKKEACADGSNHEVRWAYGTLFSYLDSKGAVTTGQDKSGSVTKPAMPTSSRHPYQKQTRDPGVVLAVALLLALCVDVHPSGRLCLSTGQPPRQPHASCRLLRLVGKRCCRHVTTQQRNTWAPLSTLQKDISVSIPAPPTMAACACTTAAPHMWVRQGTTKQR